MKKIEFVAVAAFSAISFVVAQSGNAGNHSTVKRHAVSSDSYRSSVNDDSNLLGFQAGIGVANASLGAPAGFEANPSSSRLRLNGGIYFEHRFIQELGLRLELNYVQRGFSTTDGQGAGAINNDFSVNYLEFPLLAKAQYKFARFFTPYIAAGPFLGIMIAKGETRSQGLQTEDLTLDNAISGTNFGLNFGGGALFEIVRHFNLEIGLRYSMGLINILSNPNPGVSVKLNSLQFLSGIAYSI